MIIKRGKVVSHSGAIEWGVGKVVEVTTLKATIQFSDASSGRLPPPITLSFSRPIRLSSCQFPRASRL